MSRPLLIPVSAALVALACLVLVALYPLQSEPGLPDGAFRVQVIRPRITRALYGLLPADLEARLAGQPAVLGFGEASEGATAEVVLPEEVAFHARDWTLRLRVDPRGQPTADTVLELPLILGGKARRLRCTPGPVPRGQLHTWAEGDRLSGTFEVSLSRACDAVTGQALRWPPAPLRVVGRFSRLPRGSAREGVSGR